jgi:hypothetical protein
MSRQKKNKNIQVDAEKSEVVMSETAVMDTEEKVLEDLHQEIDQARMELEKTKLEIAERKKAMAPVRELDEQEREVQDRMITRGNDRKAKESVIDAQKIHDKEMVTGKFYNLRQPGKIKEPLPYIKYPEDPVKWYFFDHDKVYTIPRGCADQINDYYHTPQFTQKQGEMTSQDGSASAIHAVDKSKKKYAFLPIGF